jgi:hypothetical protein
MKRRIAKLRLSKETLLKLDSLSLRNVGGAQRPDPTLYDPSCESCQNTCVTLCDLWSCGCTNSAVCTGWCEA